MKTTAYVGHFECSRHDPGWRHADHQGRLPAIARAVYRDMLTLFDPLLEVEGAPAEIEDLLLAHTRDHVDRVRAATLRAAESGTQVELEGELRVSGASWEAALAAVGSVLTATSVVLDGEVRNAFCAVRPPGHQASSDRPGGLSLFNAVAVAARHLRERRGLSRILVIDVGAEAGWGTAEIVATDPGVRFVTVHEETDPPVDWPGGAYPVALPAGADGAAVGAALRAAFDEATADFAPEFILVSAGFDALATDPRGGLALEPRDFYDLTAELRDRADRLCEGRLVSALEGGYDPAGAGRAVVLHLRALAGLAPD